MSSSAVQTIDVRVIEKLRVRIMSRFILVCIFTLIVTATGLTQDSNQQPSPRELQRQLDEVRSQMIKMQNRIAELEASRGISTTSSGHDPVLLQNSATPARTLLSQADDTKVPEEATSFQFKGLSLTPGGFPKTALPEVLLHRCNLR